MMECNFVISIIIWTVIMCGESLHICIVSCNLVVQYYENQLPYNYIETHNKTPSYKIYQ
jgi:hypothetical protein